MAFTHLQPVVLVGGRARRFGRDKLVEPFRGSMGGSVLVDQAILALRRALARPVWMVGDASHGVVARGDVHIADRWPGAGPLGGILTALQAASGDVIVLSGDLPCITDLDLLQLCEEAGRASSADATIARTGHAHPCIGVYRRTAIGTLATRQSRRDYAMMDALQDIQVAYVELPGRSCANANHPDDLARVMTGPEPRAPLSTF